MADTSNVGGLRGYLEAIQPSLFGISKKEKRRKDFVEISEANLAIVDDLISEMQRLSKKGQTNTKEFKNLADVAQKILDNNAKFQAVVGEVLSDIK